MAKQEGADLVVGQRAQALLDADALPEGVVSGLGEPVAQQGLTDQDEAEGAGLVEVVGGQQAEVFEADLMSLRSPPGMKLGVCRKEARGTAATVARHKDLRET